MWIWDRIRGSGGKRSDEAAEREEGLTGDSSEDEARFAEETSYGVGIAAQDAGDVIRADLDEFKPPRP
jgi:hypothetical protein